MTSSVWVAPNTRLFLVAYEGADGKRRTPSRSPITTSRQGSPGVSLAK